MHAFLKTFATPLVAAVFLALATTGLMMLFGVAAHPVHDLHQWIGGTFIAVVVLHVAWNWRALLVRLRQMPFLAITAGVALVLLALVGVTQFKGGSERHANPTRLALNALARAPLSASAPVLGLAPDEAVSRLRAKGLTVGGPASSLRDVAQASHAEIPEVFGALMENGGAQGRDDEEHDHD